MINKLQNLKIKLTSTRESVRAQKALFALGAMWDGDGHELQNTSDEYVWCEQHSSSGEFIIYSGGYGSQFYFEQLDLEQITLENLERLARFEPIARKTNKMLRSNNYDYKPFDSYVDGDRLVIVTLGRNEFGDENEIHHYVTVERGKEILETIGEQLHFLELETKINEGEKV